MQKLIVVLAAVLLGLSASAQKGPPDQARLEESRKEIQELFEQLDLTEQQESDLKQIMQDYALKVRKLEEHREKRVENFERVRELNDERDDAVKGVLNEDQFKQYKEKQNELRKKHRKGLSKPRNPNR